MLLQQCPVFLLGSERGLPASRAVQSVHQAREDVLLRHHHPGRQRDGWEGVFFAGASRPSEAGDCGHLSGHHQ